MSIVLCKMTKYKMSQVADIQQHNQREPDTYEDRSIDYTKSYLNYELHQQTKVEYMSYIQKQIKQRVKTERAIRKDAVVLCEFVITLDEEEIEGSEKSAIDLYRIFHLVYVFLKQRYGKQNVVYAVVHFDEKMPHMHFGMIPITKENRLSAKQIFSRHELIFVREDVSHYVTHQMKHREKKQEEEEMIPQSEKIEIQLFQQQIKKLQRSQHDLYDALQKEKQEGLKVKKKYSQLKRLWQQVQAYVMEHGLGEQETFQDIIQRCQKQRYKQMKSLQNEKEKRDSV